MTTLTIDPAAEPPTAQRPGFWRSYGAAWARTPGRALYLLAVFALAITAVSVLASLFWTGVGLLVLVVGLPIIVGTLFVARGLGVADRYLLTLTGLPEIAEPEWNRETTEASGFWITLVRPLRNPHYWVYLVHGMIVSPIISTITFTITVVWLSVGLGGLTYAVWGPFARNDSGEWGQYVAESLPWLFGAVSSRAIEVVLTVLAGLVVAFTLPWVLGGLARAHHAIARGMLGRWTSDDLAAELRAESAARGAAVHAEDASLRRLERDIHDGPQQRLVRLQMDLAALERRSEAGDTDAAASLARDARAQAKAALDELRALSSGVAPPLLQDRGLTAALEALAANTPLPVECDLDRAAEAAVNPETARAVYFVVAELLTNVVKHSAASAAVLKLAVREGADGLRTLDVWVVDNGRGGAIITAGHGLEGLRERVAGLRGALSLTSPLSGPTTVGVHIPLGAA
jgi:signal transduction histidine kinase